MIAGALFGCIIFPTDGFPQRELDLASTDAELQAVEQIEEIVARAGSNSPESIEPLTNLGLLYQAAGDYVLAIAAFERARDIVRVNYGFSSSEEARLLRQLVRTEEARDNHARAWGWEQDLLTLIRQQPDELWTAPILQEIAERKLDVLDRYLANEFPPEIILGCYYSWPRHDGVGRDGGEQEDCTSGSRSDVVRAVITDAQTNYAEAVAVHLRNGDYASIELRDLEMGLVRTSDFIREFNEGRRPRSMAQLQGIDLDGVDFLKDPWKRWMDAVVQLGNWPLPRLSGPSAAAEDAADEEDDQIAYITSFYRVGRQSLERQFSYQVAAGSTLDQIDALIHIADWELLHSRNGAALQGYELAIDMLAELGVEGDKVEQFFAPSVPIVLPTFSTNPLISNAGDSRGYFDVAFDISRFGRSGNIQVLDTTTNASRVAQENLVELIRTSTFRPQLEDGRFHRRSAITLRYFLEEPPGVSRAP
jgi:hypothetical protein